MTFLQLITLAASLQQPGDLCQPREAAAFAMVESSGRAGVMGDGGAAWGLGQFHRARWLECGGKASDWGKADARMQMRVLMNALNRYYREADRRGRKRIATACLLHNGAGTERQRRAYREKIERAMRYAANEKVMRHRPTPVTPG